jgi:nickel/cobalt exporter
MIGNRLNRKSLAFVIAGLFGLVVSTIAVIAHPHVFVEARSKLVFDDAGNAIAVEHAFRFDDAFTAFAIQGFDTNGDGVYSRDELAELAKINIESMADFGYFTFGDNTRIELDFDTPTDFWLEVAKVPIEQYWAMKPEDFQAMREDAVQHGITPLESVDLLELHFTLPLKDPSDALQPITLDVYDPTYYVDFRFGREDSALGTVNAPGSCIIERKEPPPLDDATAYALAQIGADQRDLPPELQSAASSQINQMIVTCGDAVAAAAGNPAQPAESAAGPAAPQVDSASQVEVGLLDQWFGTIARLQSEFYQKLVGALRAFRSNPNAAWLLIGLSFAYGVFHAAGPGHGKAIISSYVVANNETLKKGVVLSFISAFAQAVTAILLVGVAAVIFNLTSIAIQDTARWFEIGSYVLITGLGAWLLWQKALRPLVIPASPGLAHAHAHGHHDHDHHHHDHHHHIGDDGVCSTCGHAHAPTPDMLQGEISIGRAASIVLAVGLRPCTGALVVLVFALSQGMIAAGIASTLAMAVGTGITVSLLAGLAVGAKEFAVKMSGEGSLLAERVHKTIEVGGALLVFGLGATLLIAALGWG